MPGILPVAPREPGFEQYAGDLVAAARAQGARDWLDPLYFEPLASRSDAVRLAGEIAARGAELVHVHHEFGFMGSKTPVRYRFPALVRELRARAPGAKLVATAHTVLGPDYAYPWRGRGVQAPFRLAANYVFLPRLRRLWLQDTWGPLDGVIVHSRNQLASARASGCPRVREIAHYVPEEEHSGAALPARLRPVAGPMLLVFGYFTPEKAQDVAIRAMARVRGPAELVLAGGVRRGQDRGYLASCERLIAELGLGARVQITGFVSFEELDALVARAALVLLPFRETSGSGSLADLMSRRAPILASDLPLNLEIAERAPGALRYFKSEDPDDCARAIEALLARPDELAALKRGAGSYAEAFSARKMAEKHRAFFAEVMSGAS
jgi:glycosyltransferase involved in cell wall biosynthesis